MGGLLNSLYMKHVNTGSGSMPLISLIAILSISLTVNLPGLAITPIMDKLDHVFKHVTELETQLLTVLPNIVTIPFILGAGKICTRRNQIVVLGVGLAIYTITGILYFFADSMIELIVLSCILGVGCGLVIPLAASLISQYFTGAERTRQLGMKSGLSNFAVIFATLFVGWVAGISWHLSFLVYLVPVIPLSLLPFMTDRFITRHGTFKDAPEPDSTGKPKPLAAKSYHFTGRAVAILLAGVMALYFIATYGTEVISYYLPFSMNHYRLSTGDVGVATAMYFIGATVSGFLLSRIIKICGSMTIELGIALCVGGLFMIGLLHAYWTFIAGVLIIGIGYGIIQPVMYDKTSYIAPSDDKSTEYFSYLLTCNYVGIALVPFIISGAKGLFNAQGDPNFSFVFNAFVMAAVLAIAVWKRKSFVIDATAQQKLPEK